MKGGILPSVNDDYDEDDASGPINKINLSEIPSDSGESSGEEDTDSQGIKEENDVGYVKKRTFSTELGNTSED